MNVVSIHPLCDGPISLDTFREQRIAKVAEMAAVLIFKNGFADRDDAVLTLKSCGYTAFETYALVADARQAAMEHVVAMEISEP